MPEQHETVSPLRPRLESDTAGTSAAPAVPWALLHPGEVTDGCDAVLAWTPAERRLLSAMPDPGEVLEDDVWCGLEADHPGAHWALAQVSGPDFWWLRWDHDGRRELVHHSVCARRCEAGESGQPWVPCDLPDGHAGAHSYTRPA